MKSSLIGIIFSLGVIFFWFGCASVPEAEIADAEKSLKDARLANLPLYSPEDYMEAEKNYQLALSLIKKKEYKKAKLTALMVQEKTEIARKHANEKKSFSKELARKAITKTREGLIFLTNYKDVERFTPLNKYREMKLTLAGAESAFHQENYFLAKEKSYMALIAIREITEIIKTRIIEEKKREEAIDKRIQLKKEELEKKYRFPSYHIVANGEELWEIAKYKNIYNDPYQWPLIYKANRDQIKDPQLIYQGQVLLIPRNSSAEEIEHARTKAGAMESNVFPNKGAVVPSITRNKKNDDQVK